MRDYQESVTTGQTDRQTDVRKSYPYVPLCFTGDTEMRDDQTSEINLKDLQKF